MTVAQATGAPDRSIGIRGKTPIITALAASWLVVTAGAARAGVIADDLGDTQYDSLHASWDGASAHLTRLLADQTPPITASDGSLLNVGDVTLGQDPQTSAQTQIQRLLVTDTDARFSVDYIDGVAGYHSIFGVYTYDAAVDPASADLDLTPLFSRVGDDPGDTASFKVPQGHYFGFYLDADGERSSKGVYYSENFRNSDNRTRRETDHFLMLETGAGVVLAFEDYAYSRRSGLLGDQDYNDFVVGLVGMNGGTSVVPAPASLALLTLGCPAVVGRPRRERRLT